MANPLITKTVKRKAKAAKGEKGGTVVETYTVHPVPGSDWFVTFALVQDKARAKDDTNPHGFFVRHIEGLGWQPEVSIGKAQAFHAVIEAIRKANA